MREHALIKDMLATGIGSCCSLELCPGVLNPLAAQVFAAASQLRQLLSSCFRLRLVIGFYCEEHCRTTPIGLLFWNCNFLEVVSQLLLPVLSQLLCRSASKSGTACYVDSGIRHSAKEAGSSDNATWRAGSLVDSTTCSCHGLRSATVDY